VQRDFSNRRAGCALAFARQGFNFSGAYSFGEQTVVLALYGFFTKSKEGVHMMKKVLGLALVAGVLGASVAIAADDPIKQRKELMKGNGASLKGVVAMLKGEKPYDGAAVGKAMKDIGASVATFVTLFPKGSETGGETAAKPEIWTSKDEFDAIAKDLEAATAKAATAAGGGLDSFKTAFGPVGKACKACHEKFREEKKE
jgi:cytochrome c556